MSKTPDLIIFCSKELLRVTNVMLYIKKMMTPSTFNGFLNIFFLQITQIGQLRTLSTIIRLFLQKTVFT